MRRLTIRARLTVLYGGLFLLAGAFLLGVMYLAMRQQLSDQLGLKSAIQIKSSTFEGTPGSGSGSIGGGGRDPQIQLATGKIVPLSEAPQAILAQQQAIRNTALTTMLAEGGIALLVVGVAAGGLGWLVSERALRPVHDITATARRVAAATTAGKGLHERIALTGPPDEVKELADTFDDMLERLDHSFDGQQRFVANASHELRTPLAINRALVEVAITRPEASEDTRRLGETLLTVNARHERLIDGLLTLADSDNGLVAEQSTVDVRDVAEHVLDSVPEGVEVRAGRLDTAPTVGDPILLERLTQNLVDNAVRHNQPGGWLSVSTGVVAGRSVLTVSNTGPVVAPYEVETIFQPFRRLNGERQRSDRGFGLGLSIVRAVARAHGGEATAVPRPGGGLIVTVTLPTGT